jgi:Ser/Thr protein kinase RdoA (MazF antagonist)
VKCHGVDSPLDFHNEEQCISSLNAVRVPTPKPLSNLRLIDGYYFSSRPYLPGVTLLASPTDIDQHIVSIGTLLGRIHQCSFVPHNQHFYDFAFAENCEKLTLIEASRNAHPKSIDHDVMSIAFERLKQQPRDSATPLVAFVHNDFKPANLLISENILYVLDFDKACGGNADFDLGLALFHLGHENSNLLTNRMDNFLSGYYQMRMQPIAMAKLLTWIGHAGAAFLLWDYAIAHQEWRKGASWGSTWRQQYFINYCYPMFCHWLKLLA